MKPKLFAIVMMAVLFSFPLKAQVYIDSIEIARLLNENQQATTVILEDDSILDSIIPTFDTNPELSWQENIRLRLDNLLTGKLSETIQTGLMVWDLTGDSCLYSYNARLHLRPASTMKCVTAIVALDRLGSYYKFSTRLYFTGSIVDSTRVLQGNLYCVGGMDPMFDSSDLSSFVSAVKELGISAVDGNIYVDLSFKEREKMGWGWCWDDDNPSLSPILVGRRDDFAERFQKALRQAGIEVSGIGEQQLPSSAQLLDTRFHSIDQVMHRMMKRSDNLFAESMFYQIAAAGRARWAKAQHARAEIKQLVKRIGMNPSDCIIADGSGLSLYNYLSAELEVKLLRYAFLKPDIYNTFLNTLPIAGVDGTLRNRMKSTPAQGNVRAKTGTVRGVSSLAGYLTASNGNSLCFAIISNGGLTHSPMRNLQNKICVALCQ